MLVDACAETNVVLAGTGTRSTRSVAGAPLTLAAIGPAGALPLLTATAFQLTATPGVADADDAARETCTAAPFVKFRLSVLLARAPCN